MSAYSRASFQILLADFIADAGGIYAPLKTAMAAAPSWFPRTRPEDSMPPPVGNGRTPTEIAQREADRIAYYDVLNPNAVLWMAEVEREVTGVTLLSLTTAQIFDAVDRAEEIALLPPARKDLEQLYILEGNVSFAAGAKAPVILEEIFPEVEGSTSRTNLNAVLNPKQTWTSSQGLSTAYPGLFERLIEEAP